MVCYCKKCGFIGAVAFSKKCKNCGTKLNLLSEEMKLKYRIFDDDWSDLIFGIRRLDTNEEKSKRIEELLSRKDYFIKNEIANNPLFSMEEYKNQIKKDKKSFYDISQCPENKINEQQAINSTYVDGLHYCKKCGRVVLRHADKTGYMDDTCDYCKSKVYLIPEKYWLDGNSSFITKEQEELLREELVKTSLEFDEVLFNRRESELAARNAEWEAGYARIKEIQAGKNSISCSYCGSTNVSKIGFLNRLGSAELWGLGSDKIGKQFHCNNCGANF